MILAEPNPELVPEERKAALHAEYMAQIAELPPPRITFSQKFQAISHIISRRLTRTAIINDLITVSITILLTLIMTALILNYAAQDTLPGDFLYGVKRISENTRISFTFSEIRRAELETTLNQTRLAEIQQLIQLKRAAVVEFRGVIETRTENLWIIEGLIILLSDDTIVEGDPREGDPVEIIGLLRTNSVLVADTITLIK